MIVLPFLSLMEFVKGFCLLCAGAIALWGCLKNNIQMLIELSSPYCTSVMCLIFRSQTLLIVLTTSQYVFQE